MVNSLLKLFYLFSQSLDIVGQHMVRHDLIRHAVAYVVQQYLMTVRKGKTTNTTVPSDMQPSRNTLTINPEQGVDTTTAEVTGTVPSLGHTHEEGVDQPTTCKTTRKTTRNQLFVSAIHYDWDVLLKMYQNGDNTTWASFIDKADRPCSYIGDNERVENMTNMYYFVPSYSFNNMDEKVKQLRKITLNNSQLRLKKDMNEEHHEEHHSYPSSSAVDCYSMFYFS